MPRFFSLAAAVLWGYLTWRLTTTPNLVIAPENWLNTITMMGGHFIFFGIQAVLLRPLTPYALPLASLYGLLIEFVQLRVPGRSADPLDWILDTLGALTFLAILKRLKQGNRDD